MSDATTDIFTLSDQAVDRLAAGNPLLATYLGIAGQDHAWPDLSPEGLAENRALHASLVTEARACEVTDDRDRLARDVLIEYCEGEIGLHDAGDHHYGLNNIVSPHQELRFVFGSQAADTVAAWEAIISRVETIGEPLDGFRRTLEEGRTQGRTVSRRQVETVIEQGDMAVGEQSSFDQLLDKLAKAPFASGDADNPSAEERHLADRLTSAIGSAKDAYRVFNGYLRDTYLPEAVETDAVGEERYLRAARTFLGTDLDARATYRWGWDEVERLWSAMHAACAEIDAAAPVSEVIDALKHDPAYAVETTEEFVEVMAERQAHALASLEGVHFDVPDQIRRIDVQIEPAGGASAAHYVPPSEDFSRAGSVWYPIEGQRNLPLFQEVTTAYHEGFPGHHLQVGFQATLSDQLSRFHRMVAWYPGSGEGWALYAEHLMGELGFLEKPEYVVGLLSSQLLRSCRIAIDIGTHLELPIPDDVTFHPGEHWNFDLAYELLVERALLGPETATSEVTRYYGWPGQAISYKVGEQAILDLRAEKAAQGDFDPKAFHSDVLSVGSIGLDLMRSRLTDN
ncbi:MAG: DUF885 domain-containing protein [Actinomycetota bacterium]